MLLELSHLLHAACCGFPVLAYIDPTLHPSTLHVRETASPAHPAGPAYLHAFPFPIQVLRMQIPSFPVRCSFLGLTRQPAPAPQRQCVMDCSLLMPPCAKYICSAPSLLTERRPRNQMNTARAAKKRKRKGRPPKKPHQARAHASERRQPERTHAAAELTVSADNSSDQRAVRASDQAKVEEEERSGDGPIHIAGIEELPAPSDGSPALAKYAMVAKPQTKTLQ